MHRLLVLVALATTAASAAPTDPLRDRIIAGAGAQVPASLTFDRTVSITQKGGGQIDHVVRVERWDGRGWTLLSMNGKPPSASDIRNAAKAQSTLPVPGYYRLATLLTAATERATDAQGHTVYRIPQLPPGSVPSSDGDLSQHLAGEATVATTPAGEPWVQRLKLTAREPFKIGWMLKVAKFEQVSEYKLDPAGVPRLATQIADSTGTLLGISGGEHNEVVFVYR